MFDLFANTNKFEPFIVAAFEDKEQMCGLLFGVFIHEKRGLGKLFSSRFVIYGGPLLTGNEKQQSECLDVLLKALIEHTRKKALFIQFRNFFSQKHLLPVYNKHGFGLIERLNYIVDLSDQKNVLQKMSESRKRQIKKALNNGSSIIEAENIEQLKEFYKILYKLYRYKIRKPLPDWSFFENFYKGSRDGKLGIIRLIKYDDKIIGGILSPIFEKKCIWARQRI